MDEFEKVFDSIMRPKFSVQFLNDINKVWNAIASDSAEFCDDNELAVEMCIDANRLAIYGSEKSESELRDHIAAHNYSMVLRELCKVVTLI